MTEFLFDGPTSAPATLVVAHGAGAAMDSPFMEDMARGLASRGARVARFEFPYMAARRRAGAHRPPDREAVLLDTWRSVVADLGGGARVVAGGKSMGGRMASMVAAELAVKGLVCLGYPFHAPGRPDRPRTAHLADVPVPGLIVQGTRDPFGTAADVDGYALSPSLRVHWLEDGDHDFRPRKSSGRTVAQNREEAIEAVIAFLREIGALTG